MTHQSKEPNSQLFLMLKEKLIDKNQALDLPNRVSNTMLLLSIVESMLSALKEKSDQQEFAVGQMVYVVNTALVHSTQIETVLGTGLSGCNLYWLRKLGFWRKLRQFLFFASLWYEKRPGVAGEDFFASEAEARQFQALKSLRIQLLRHRAVLGNQSTVETKP